MARAATTSDAFNAVAEPRRREILTYLVQERQVGEIVVAIGLDQPSVSKHLGVLRQVGLVRVRRNGRHRLYSVPRRRQSANQSDGPRKRMKRIPQKLQRRMYDDDDSSGD
jgi:DNA-binding transcriptional ArsR family regulator